MAGKVRNTLLVTHKEVIVDNANNSYQDNMVELVIVTIPLWVKGMVMIGILLSLIQFFNNRNTLVDAIKKQRANVQYRSGKYADAIKSYNQLSSNYPQDIELIKSLGFAYYHSGQYYEALNTFKLLKGKQLGETDIKKIDEVVSEMLKEF